MTEITNPEAAETATSPPQAPVGWAALAIAGIAQMLVMLDSTVVNVAIPSIGTDLHASSIALQWTVSGYVLTYGALLLFGGRLADSIGRRTAFLAGLALFAAASLACGLAQNGSFLVTGRVVQGIGAALLSAAALSIIISTYGSIESQLKIALTAWSALGVVGATVGVILGGAIVQALSWRWAFLINLPIVVVVAVAAVMRLAPMRAAGGPTSLKIPSAIVATTGIGALCYGLSRFEDGISSAAPWIIIAVGAALMIGLFLVEDRSDDPLLPVSLLRTPVYALSGVGLVLAATLMLGALYVTSNYFQSAHGMSPLATGFALLPLCLASLIAAFATPAIATQIGMAKLYFAGTVLQIASLATIVAVTASGTGNAAIVIVALTVFGAGLPTMFVPLYSFGSAPIPPEQAGVGSGLLNTFNEAGAGVGLAVVAPITAAIIASQLQDGAANDIAATAGAHAGFLALGGVAVLAAGIALVLGRLANRSQT